MCDFREEVACFFADDFFADDLEDEWLLLECFAFDERDFEDFDDADDVEWRFTVVQRTRLRRLECERILLQRTAGGAVQPTSASARNDSGIASTGVGPSRTARTAASDKSDRTSAMIRTGR